LEATAAQSARPITNVTKKALMAVSGLVLTGYVVGHLVGNMTFYAGAPAIDAYSAFLHEHMAALWLARAVLFGSVVIHIVAAIDLYLRKAAARPTPYARYQRVASSLGARIMLWTGFVLLLFVVYHVLHLTLGTVHPKFVPGAVWQNLMVGLSVTPASIFYVVCMVALGLHLAHGVYSMTQSVGVALRRDGMRTLRRGALALAVILAIGFASIPLTILYHALTRGR
jgi:succinate dehydrogenase / fumarate reductase, cytochrome b subunit